MLLALSLRLYGFYQVHMYTFDEIVYTNLSSELNDDHFKYTSQPLYEYYASRGHTLPNYLNKPLFKHPPLFCYLGSAMQKLTKNKLLGSYLPSLFFGLALIPLIFYIASELFDKQCGLLAALFIVLDPIIWICSEKIWLETILTFFMLLALFTLIKAIANEKDKTFFLAGLATGLAMLSKMTGALTLFFALSFIAIYKPTLYKKKSLWIYISTSIAMYLPWIIWNYIIYKNKFLYNLLTIQGELSFHTFAMIAAIICGAFIVYLAYRYLKKSLSNIEKINLQKMKLFIIPAMLIIIFNPYMLKGIYNSFNLFYIPNTGWTLCFFSTEPALFYIRRLIEMSPFYLFALLGIIAINKLTMKHYILYAWSLFIIGLFIIHGNYQSRYILPAIPTLLILTAAFIIQIGNSITIHFKNKPILKSILLFLYILVLLFFIIKTLIINLNLSLLNNMAYF